MSTTLLYHACSIRGYRRQSSKCVPVRIEVAIAQLKDCCRGAAREGHSVIVKGAKIRAADGKETREDCAGRLSRRVSRLRRAASGRDRLRASDATPYPCAGAISLRPPRQHGV